MKTYTAFERLGRLTAYLVAVGKSFNFDGSTIEFTASENFMQRMFASDQTLAKIDFDMF